MKPLAEVFAGKRVLLTGHTGFKGTWMTLWLHALGAKTFGYALPPSTTPSLFELSGAEQLIHHEIGDVRDAAHLAAYVAEVKPEFVFHLAAQPLVLESYQTPIDTVATNVMGTANLLEAVRTAARPCKVVIVTSDKCYENREWTWGYRENEAMGGHDPYSMSKGCAELVTASWRKSFFSGTDSQIRVATARAGNVIGGGDWSADRIVVDCVKSLIRGEPIIVRSPSSTRPWQHVLEPLSGYLCLAAMLDGPTANRFADAWNFGPAVQSVQPVRALVEAILREWGSGEWSDTSDRSGAPHEARLLSLSWEKAYHELRWEPVWDFGECIAATMAWYKAWHQQSTSIRQLSLQQIAQYTTQAHSKGLAWAGARS